MTYSPPPPGLIIAAAASNSGKTTLTLALLRALRRTGVAVASAKLGPDYLDPEFHHAASGRVCYNLDRWAMRPESFATIAARSGQSERVDLLIVEGVMGMFDGANDGSGSAADVAAYCGWPLVLVVDASGMAASVAALVHGFHSFRADVNLAAVIFNRVGSAAHAQLLADACAPLGVPVIGSLLRDPELCLPERHLGLVQAREHPQLEIFLEHAADCAEQQLDLSALRRLARPTQRPQPLQPPTPPLTPLGHHIAIAADQAFAFCYPFILDAWRAEGIRISSFSPLADQPPAADADAIYLPGGYPELHAERLAACSRFHDGLRQAAARGAVVYGECGGYMVLGEELTDGDGRAHKMAGLLPIKTSFAAPRLRLGYRCVRLLADGPLGSAGTAFRGHEFHYAEQLLDTNSSNNADRLSLFHATDARGRNLGPVGYRRDNVCGSFVHLVDRALHQEPV